MRLLTLMPVALLCITALAGYASSGGGDDGGEGTFALAVADSLAGGTLQLKGVYLHGAGNASDWADAFGPAGDSGSSLAMAFKGSGTNVSINGSVPAGDYDGVRILF